MCRDRMDEDEAQAWRELEEAEQAVVSARWRFIEASNRASQRHQPHLQEQQLATGQPA